MDAVIIIIARGRQCKEGRDRLAPYQSEDPIPTIPTHRMKEEKGKIGPIEIENIEYIYIYIYIYIYDNNYEKFHCARDLMNSIVRSFH